MAVADLKARTGSFCRRRDSRFKDAATSSARGCRNNREKTNDKMLQTGPTFVRNNLRQHRRSRMSRREKTNDYGSGQPFDERSPWKSSAEVSRNRDLMSAQRGFFVPGDPGTPQLPRNPGNGKKTFLRRKWTQAIFTKAFQAPRCDGLLDPTRAVTTERRDTWELLDWARRICPRWCACRMTAKPTPPRMST